MNQSEAQPKKRRGRGEGGIYQRASDDRWCGTVELGWQDGKRKRRTVYGKTKEEVKREVRRLTLEREKGLPVQSKRRKLADFLNQWLADISTTVRPRTLKAYTYITTAYLIPHLGRHTLEKLTQHDVRQMLESMQADGKSARTAAQVRAVLRTALNEAMRQDLLSRNVAALTRAPKQTTTEARALSAQEARRLLTVANGTRWEALFTVAVSLGLRQAELLGLRWEDVDLERSTLRIRYQLQEVDPADERAGVVRLMPTWALVEPKTTKSRRTIPLPKPVAASLKRHHRMQLAERLMAGERWQHFDLVFASTVGTPIDPANLRKVYRQALTDAGLPVMRFHDLRHSAGSLMAAMGVPPATVQAILGHANFSTTMNIYTHSTSDALEDAAVKLAGLFDKASS